MRRFLLDTGIAGHYINMRRGVYQKARQEIARGNMVGIGIPVLAELEYGTQNSDDPVKSLKLLKRALPVLCVWPITFESATHFGRISTEMKRLGLTIGQIDRLIAGIAFSLPNCTVVSADNDMLRVPGLPVENWLLT